MIHYLATHPRYKYSSRKPLPSESDNRIREQLIHAGNIVPAVKVVAHRVNTVNGGGYAKR